MFHRTHYLNSIEGGKLPSDFLMLKGFADKAIQAITAILDDKLGNHPALGVLSDTSRESTDPDIRKDTRKKYIEKLKQWLQDVEKIIKTWSKPRPKNTDKDLEMSLIEPDAISDVDIKALQEYISRIKLLVPQLKNAYEIERYTKITEIRITEEKEIRVDRLEYNVDSGCFELRTEDAKQLPDPTFRIINGRRYLDPEEFGISADQETYAKLQRLGATLNYKVERRYRDEALSAQLINEYGVYLRKLMYALLRREERTDTFNVKQKLCQQIFNRITASQIIEGAYGGSIKELKNAIELFNQEIEKLILAAKADLEAIRQKCTGDEKPWYEKLFELYQSALESDKKFANTLQQKITAITEKHALLDEDAELYKSGNDPHDTRITLDILADELIQLYNAIIADGTHASIAIDVVRKCGISSGQFSEVSVNAQYRCDNYDFPISVRMDPEYQGKFKGIRQISASELASGERDTRDILFALICVKVGDIANPDKLRELLDEIHPVVVTSRGWRRLLCCTRIFQRKQIEDRIDNSENHTDAQVAFQLYPIMKRKIQATEESYTHGAVTVCKAMMGAVQRSFRDSWHGVCEIANHFWTELNDDFDFDQHGPASTPTVYTYAASVKNEKKEHFDKEHKHLAAHPLSISRERKREHKYSELGDVPELGIKYKTLPVFRPQIEPDELAVFSNVIKSLGGYYTKRLRARPIMWGAATVVGLAGGLTAYYPESVATTLEKIGISKAWADGFVAMSIAISEATTKSTLFQCVGTTTTIQQLVAMFLETLEAGADSMLLQGLAEIKRNLPIAFIGVTSTTALGKLLSELFEVFKDDLGKKQVIAEFFSGIKVALIVYESFLAEAGERSPIANTAAGALNLCFNMIRAGASLAHIPIMLGCAATGSPGIAASAWEKMWRPWDDIVITLINAHISAADAALQTALPLAQGVSSVCYMTKEIVTYPIAKFTPRCMSEPFVAYMHAAEQAVGYCLTSLHNNTVRRFHRFRERYELARSHGLFQKHKQLQVVDTEHNLVMKLSS